MQAKQILSNQFVKSLMASNFYLITVSEGIFSLSSKNGGYFGLNVKSIESISSNGITVTFNCVNAQCMAWLNVSETHIYIF